MRRKLTNRVKRVKVNRIKDEDLKKLLSTLKVHTHSKYFKELQKEFLRRGLK